MACPGAEGALDASVDLPSASVDMPSGSVDMPSGSVDMPSGSVDMPSGSVGVPSVDVSGKVPDMPSVGGGDVSGDLPSASIDASGSVPSGEVDVSVPTVSGTVEGVTGAVGGLSADVGAKIDDVAVKGPDMPSGDLKKPKKSLFGGIGGMFGSGKGKMEVSVGNSSTCFTLFFFFLVHEARDELVYDRLGVSWTGVFLFFYGENYPNPVFFFALGLC